MSSRLLSNSIKSGSTASVVLDIMRFLAAAVVVLSHLGTPEWSGSVLKLINVVTYSGLACVMVFFILSGYFISSSVLRMFDSNTWSWKNYLTSRLTRLWIVLIPALLLTYIWATAQSHYFGSDFVREGASLTKVSDLGTLLSNIFFLQYIHDSAFGQMYGLNNPLWSLAFEFWFYILFPCLILTFKSRSTVGKIISFTAFCLISVLVGWKVLAYFLIWLLGAVIALLRPIVIKNNILKFGLISGAAVVLVISTKVSKVFGIDSSFRLAWEQYPFDALVAICCTILVYLVLSFFKTTATSNWSNVARFLAGFSYTLYLVHYPIVNFIAASRSTDANEGKFIWQESTANYFIYLPATFIAILIYAWVVSLLTEKHTERVRKLVLSLFKSTSRSKSPLPPVSKVS